MYFKLFSTILLTKGASRALLIDTNQRKPYLIPLSLYNILSKYNGFKIEDVYQEFEEKEILDEYFNFLTENNLIFKCDSKDELKLFPDLNLDWHYPAIIANAVIEVFTKEDIVRFLSSKGGLFIPYIQIIILSEITDKKHLCVLINEALKCNSKGIQVLFDNRIAKLHYPELTEICNSHATIETIIAFNSNEDSQVKSYSRGIFLRKADNRKSLHCGLVNSDYFTYHPSHYTESLDNNTCLNRKIAVDADGYIKNCPSLREHYGNVKETTLVEAIEKPGFKKYWSICKDNITKCKDCEFRHVCTDCRAYLENPEDIFSAPLKCGYDPYTNEWSDWSKNPLKQRAIDLYGMREIIENE